MRRVPESGVRPLKALFFSGGLDTFAPVTQYALSCNQTKEICALYDLLAKACKDSNQGVHFRIVKVRILRKNNNHACLQQAVSELESILDKSDRDILKGLCHTEFALTLLSYKRHVEITDDPITHAWAAVLLRPKSYVAWCVLWKASRSGSDYTTRFILNSLWFFPEFRSLFKLDVTTLVDLFDMTKGIEAKVAESFTEKERGKHQEELYSAVTTKRRIHEKTIQFLRGEYSVLKVFDSFRNSDSFSSRALSLSIDYTWEELDKSVTTINEGTVLRVMNAIGFAPNHVLVVQDEEWDCDASVAWSEVAAETPRCSWEAVFFSEDEFFRPHVVNSDCFKFTASSTALKPAVVKATITRDKKVKVANCSYPIQLWLDGFTRPHDTEVLVILVHCATRHPCKHEYDTMSEGVVAAWVLPPLPITSNPMQEKLDSSPASLALDWR